MLYEVITALDQPEVEDLDEIQAAPVAAQVNVRGFDVSMDELTLVGLGERVAHLLEHVDHP